MNVPARFSPRWSSDPDQCVCISSISALRCTNPVGAATYVPDHTVPSGMDMADHCLLITETNSYTSLVVN